MSAVTKCQGRFKKKDILGCGKPDKYSEIPVRSAASGGEFLHQKYPDKYLFLSAIPFSIGSLLQNIKKKTAS
jgi:hypothetical protein